MPAMAHVQRNESYHGRQSFCYVHSLNRQHKSIWLLALLISLSLHAMVLLQRGSNIGMTHAKATTQPVVTWLQVQESAKAEVEPEAPQPNKLKQVQHQSIKTKTVKSTPSKPKQTAAKNTQPQKKVIPAPVSQASSLKQTSATPSIQQGFLQQQKQQYLALVMQHIEQYKRYPKAARRRGVEGMVSVSLMINADGSIQQTNIKSDETILQKAVRKALSKATPLPTPPRSLSFPISCRFSMQFRLHL